MITETEGGEDLAWIRTGFIEAFQVGSWLNLCPKGQKIFVGNRWLQPRLKTGLKIKYQG